MYTGQLRQETVEIEPPSIMPIILIIQDVAATCKGASWLTPQYRNPPGSAGLQVSQALRCFALDPSFFSSQYFFLIQVFPCSYPLFLRITNQLWGSQFQHLCVSPWRHSTFLGRAPSHLVAHTRTRWPAPQCYSFNNPRIDRDSSLFFPAGAESSPSYANKCPQAAWMSFKVKLRCYACCVQLG